MTLDESLERAERYYLEQPEDDEEEEEEEQNDTTLQPIQWDRKL